MKKFILLFTIAFTVFACTPTVKNTTEPIMQSTFTLSSPAFANNMPIPNDYSCKGKNISPALSWNEPPAGTQSFALIMDDPDAPGTTWIHWVILNIPASVRELSEAVPNNPQLRDGSIQGENSSHSNGYQGPCPPSGTHHYHFNLYALDTTLSLPTDAKKADVLKAMEGHILANAELIGLFSK